MFEAYPALQYTCSNFASILAGIIFASTQQAQWAEFEYGLLRKNHLNLPSLHECNLSSFYDTFEY